MVKALLAKEQKIEVPIPHDIKLYYNAVSSTDSIHKATQTNETDKQVNHLYINCDQLLFYQL